MAAGHVMGAHWSRRGRSMFTGRRSPVASRRGESRGLVPAVRRFGTLHRARSNTSNKITRDDRASRIARGTTASATNINTTSFPPSLSTYRLLLAPEHTEYPRLPYIHDLRTMSHFSRLDSPLRCLANLILPHVLPLAPVSLPCARYGCRPSDLICTL
jgi:hypothetical protein